MLPCTPACLSKREDFADQTVILTVKRVNEQAFVMRSASMEAQCIVFREAVTPIAP